MWLQKCRSIWTHGANQFLKYEKKCKNDDDKYAVDVKLESVIVSCLLMCG